MFFLHTTQTHRVDTPGLPENGSNRSMKHSQTLPVVPWFHSTANLFAKLEMYCLCIDNMYNGICIYLLYIYALYVNFIITNMYFGLMRFIVFLPTSFPSNALLLLCLACLSFVLSIEVGLLSAFCLSCCSGTTLKVKHWTTMLMMMKSRRENGDRDDRWLGGGNVRDREKDL